MKIGREQKVEKVASDKKESGALKHVFIKRVDESRGFAVACDGHKLVMIPIELDEKDEEGVMPAQILGEGRRVFQAKESIEIILRDKAEVKKEGLVHIIYEREKKVTSPNWAKAIPKGRPIARFSVSVSDVLAVSKALDVDRLVFEVHQSAACVVLKDPKDTAAIGLVLRHPVDNSDLAGQKDLFDEKA